ELTYDLARLHAMAYSTNLAAFDVRTEEDRPDLHSSIPGYVFPAESPEARANSLRHLTNAITFFERAIVLLKNSTNRIEYKEWLVLPLEVGHAWCLDQAGSCKEALAVYRRTL